MFFIEESIRKHFSLASNQDCTLEHSLEKAKSFEEKIFREYGKDFNQYLSLVDKKISDQKKAYEETISLTVPQMIENIKKEIPMFQCFIKNWKETKTEEPPKAVVEFCHNIEKINEQTNIVPKYYSQIFISLKQAVVAYLSKFTLPASQVNQQPMETQSNPSQLPLEKVNEAKLKLAEMDKNIQTIISQLDQRNHSSEFKKLVNFIQSMNSRRDLSFADYQAIKVNYESTYLPLIKKVQDQMNNVKIMIKEMCDLTNEYKTLKEKEPNLFPQQMTWLDLYIQFCENLKSPQPLTSKKITEIQNAFKQAYPQVKNFLTSIKANQSPIIHNPLPVPATPIPPIPIHPDKNAKKSNLKVERPVTPIPPQVETVLTEEDRLNIVKEIFKEVRLQTEAFHFGLL
jgi:primosomal protein N''